jgi:hypothetical protein
MRITLEVRDIELRQARSAAAQALERWKEATQGDEPQIAPRHWQRKDRSNKRDDTEKSGRPLWRDIAIVACVAALGTVLYPTIVALIPDDWFSQTGQTVPPLHGTAGVPRKPQPPVAAPVPPQSMDIVIRPAKVHADPSKISAVLATLPRDTKIIPLEQRGNWVLVSIDGIGGEKKHRQGWVYASFLKAVPESRNDPAAAARP